MEEAYRSEVWNPSRGRLSAQKGIPLQAAKVDLQTLTNEAKVRLDTPPASTLPRFRKHDGQQVWLWLMGDLLSKTDTLLTLDLFS